jgi:gamma-glutamyltranspeptidase/glutathione hydrolase
MVAASGDPATANAAREALDGGGGAVDAVVAGFLAAAGRRAGVLLAPVVALVSGVGVGARAFDGRAAQPGRGARRPRGLGEGESPSPAAEVAAPRSLAVLALLHASRGRMALPALARDGAAAAAAAGAAGRARIIEAFGRGGVLVLRDPALRAALLEAGGALAGGALSEADLDEARPDEAAARESSLAAAQVLRAPWDSGPGAAEVILAADSRGVVAALSFQPGEDVPLETVQLAMGRAAVAVRRSVARLAPGSVLPAPAPIALLVRRQDEGEGGRARTFFVAAGAPGAADIDLAALQRLSTAEILDRTALEPAEGAALLAVWTHSGR